jgi:DeoR/GlpR family transcriptional regulator of sugar metabolism
MMMKVHREHRQAVTGSGTGTAGGGRLRRDDRFERIMAALRIGSSVRIADLAARFDVSTETVRRDLDELSRQGLVDRTYGGAAPAAAFREPAFDERARERVAERRRIGACTAGLIEDGDVLMIDSGSTTVHFVQRLAAATPRITVLTNCLGVALALGPAAETRVVLCPGDYRAQEGGVFGPETAAFLRRFRATKAIIGASGLTAEGPVELDSAATWVKRTMIERADRRFLLIDESKLGAQSIETVCPLDQIDDLVTSAMPTAALRDALDAAGIVVHVAGEAT